MSSTDILTPDEMALVRAHAPNSLHDLDGFNASLRVLVLEERYSLTDIAAMFGVTRERMRQLCVKLGIPTPKYGSKGGLLQTRMWSESEQRFYPVQKGEMKRASQMAAALERAQRREAILKERHAKVKAIADEIRASGQKVTLKAVAEVLLGRTLSTSQASPLLRGYWHMAQAGTMEPINQACGLPYSGRPGRKAKETAS